MDVDSSISLLNIKVSSDHFKQFWRPRLYPQGDEIIIMLIILIMK